LFAEGRALKQMTKIHARFIGKDGSMGFHTNQVYEMLISRPKASLFSRRNDVVIESSGVKCPYVTIEAFLANWTDIKTI